jgi:hypothetical protein
MKDVAEAKFIRIVRGKFMLVVRREDMESEQNQSLFRGAQFRKGMVMMML